MTDDEIIKMALVHFGAVITPSDLEYKLAKLVANSAAAEEREACAKLCEEKETYGDPVQCWLDDCAASIRARGDK